MQTIFKTAVAVAVAMSGRTEAAGDSEMRFLAKQNQSMQVVIEKLGPDLVRNGANQEAISDQVELAMRRCGFGMDTSGLASALAVVVVHGLSEKDVGYSGGALLQVKAPTTVDGETVLVDTFTRVGIFSGPPGSAGTQVRNVLAQLLDQFCNSYSQARDKVRGKTKK
jgi:hypothetical protein